MDARSIAEATGVTLRFSLKILRKLVAEGLICSYKGTQGGYEIARPLEEISLYDVISVVDGPFQISRCIGDEGFICTCSHESPCKIRAVYTELSEQMEERLRAATFDKLI